MWISDHQAISPVAFDDHVVDSGQLKTNLPALSWTVFELDASRG